MTDIEEINRTRENIINYKRALERSEQTTHVLDDLYGELMSPLTRQKLESVR